MQEEECCWNISTSVRLYGVLWIPDTPMNALILMVHGIGEHSGCYVRWAQKFVDQSIGFLAIDLRGHGRSTGKRGHATMKEMKNDLKMILKDVRKRIPKIPIVLYGHSMGGQVVLSYALDKGAKVQGVIASSPWLQLVKPPAKIMIRAAKILSRVAPSLTLTSGVKANQLAHDGMETKSTKTDPLMHKRISVKLFTDLLENGEHIMHSKHRLHIPLLLMHGSADQLTSYHASKMLANNAGKYTEYKQWKGMYHDLHNDTNNEAVFQYVMKWITKLVKNNGSIQNHRKLYRVA